MFSQKLEKGIIHALLVHIFGSQICICAIETVFFSISFCLTTKDTHITCTKAPTVLEVVIDLILRQILIYLKREKLFDALARIF